MFHKAIRLISMDLIPYTCLVCGLQSGCCVKLVGMYLIASRSFIHLHTSPFFLTRGAQLHKIKIMLC